MSTGFALFSTNGGIDVAYNKTRSAPRSRKDVVGTYVYDTFSVSIFIGIAAYMGYFRCLYNFTSRASVTMTTRRSSYTSVRGILRQPVFVLIILVPFY